MLHRCGGFGVRIRAIAIIASSRRMASNVRRKIREAVHSEYVTVCAGKRMERDRFRATIAGENGYFPSRPTRTSVLPRSAPSATGRVRKASPTGPPKLSRTSCCRQVQSGGGPVESASSGVLTLASSSGRSSGIPVGIRGSCRAHASDSDPKFQRHPHVFAARLRSVRAHGGCGAPHGRSVAVRGFLCRA